MRFYQSLKGPLKIYEVGDVWVIGIRHIAAGNISAVHNCVHRDDYIFSTYPTLQAAKEAAERIMELRQIPLMTRIEVV